MLLNGPESPQNCPFPWGICTPRLHPKRHIDQFSRFCTAHCKVSHYFTMHRYVPPSKKNCPLPLVFCHPAEEGQSHGRRQRAQKIGKDCVCGYGDMMVDKQTHRHTDTHVLITILCHRSSQRSKHIMKECLPVKNLRYMLLRKYVFNE